MPGEVTALLSALCYSLSYICLRRGQSNTDAPDNGLFPILLIGALVLGGSSAVHGFLDDDRVPTVAWTHSMWILVAAGLVGPFLGRLTLYASIRELGATRGVVIKSIAPLVTLLIALWALGELPDDLDFLGFVLLGLGIFLLYSERVWWPHRLGKRSLFQRGLMLGVMAAVLQGSGHALRKFGLLAGFDPVYAAAIESIAAAVLYTGVLALTGRLTPLVRHYRDHASAYFAAAALLTAAGVLLFFFAVSTTSVTVVAAILATEPVLVAGLSVVLMRDLERLTWAAVAASVLVAFGIILLNMD